MSNIGYSDKINDPVFQRYAANTKKYAWIFAWIMFFGFTIGFTIYGQVSDEVDNPQAFFIGVGLGVMMLVIAFFTNLSRSRSRTWDGVVTEHKKELKKRRVNSSGNDYYWQEYMTYTVVITESGGKQHEIKVEKDDTLYNYYQDGDHVRHHGALNTYEKYDKSKDTIIFCNACATKHEITEDHCHRCKCPLLK